ncbi:MAG: TRAP transporter large permease subunit, partial [Alphaproteobacteria bacterium]
PPLILIFMVLGSIMVGLAAPTEAAGMGAMGTVVLTIVYRNFGFAMLQEALVKTLMVTCMILLILIGGTMFSGVFIASGGLVGTQKLLAALHLGGWGTLSLLLLLTFLSGFALDIISIILIIIPIAVPIMTGFGFDPVWFCILFLLVLQTSFLTPPVAPAVFYLRAISPPEMTLSHMYRGVVPFIAMEIVGLALVIAFPELALWLPSKLLGFE